MKFGLVLSGGGARGLAHTVVIDILDELEVKPEIIAGTSMGAVIGVLYSCGYSGKNIRNIFLEMGVFRSATLFDFSFSRDGIIKGEQIVKRLQKMIPYTKIEELPILVKITATDIIGKKSIVFTKGNIFDAIRASISIPGIFKPVNIGGKLLFDGGITNQLPVDLLNNKKIIASDVTSGAQYLRKNKMTAIESFITAFQIMQIKNVLRKTKNKPNLCYLDFNINGYSILDFHEIEKILKQANRRKKEFKEMILEYLK